MIWFITYVCDKCGVKETLPNNVGAQSPSGWGSVESVPDKVKPNSLCSKCFPIVLDKINNAIFGKTP